MKINQIQQETEIKIRVRKEALDSVRAKLLEAGFREAAPRSLEMNIMFDFPDQRIRKSDSALRLRDYNGSHILTWKGPATADRGLKIRDEAETEIGSREEALHILRNLGLEPVFEYSKYREKFRRMDKAKFEVCIDETKAGLFIEIEAPRENIPELLTTLGLSISDSVRETYVELLRGKDGGK